MINEKYYNKVNELTLLEAILNELSALNTTVSAPETDPVFLASDAAGISSGDISDWNTAYGWGDHATAGYLTSFSETDPVFNAWLLATPPLYSFTETDPVYIASSWYTTTNNASNWDTAYGWGNHASAGYLTSQISHADVVVDGDFTSQGIMLRGASSGTYSILTDNSANWNTAYSWGNHASAGYLTSITGLMVTSALGYTPYNSTNPSGFITSASLSSYMLLSGGTFTGAIIEQPVILTDAATIAVNATLGNIFDVTLGGNRILGNPTGAVDGQKLIFRVAQDGSGNRTLSFDTKYANTVYVTALSTGASKIDHIGVIYKSSTDKFYIVAFTPQNP